MPRSLFSKLPAPNIWKQGSTEKGLIPELLQGKIQDELGASCGTKKEDLNTRGMLKEHRSHPERDLNGKRYNNLSNKIVTALDYNSKNVSICKSTLI